MKFIKPKFEILEQAPEMDGMLKHIERCGRVCYRSEDKITEDSAEKFVERMKSLGHGSVIEHGTVYIKNFCDGTFLDGDYNNLGYKYDKNKYSKVASDYALSPRGFYITTNYRVILQGDYEAWDEALEHKFDKNWLDDLQYQCESTEFHEKRVTVKFTTDIGISREFNRHRVNSVSEQSTRYCNYSKDKFGNEISVVPPKRLRDNYGDFYRDSIDENFMDEVAEEIVVGGDDCLTDLEVWMFANIVSQWSYNKLTRKFGWSAQEARSILPLDTQTEFYHTAFISDWKHFFELRCDEHAHPMARELAIPLREEFVKRGLIKE